MARWATGAKWAAGPAPGDQRDTPLVLSLSEGLGLNLRMGRNAREICVLLDLEPRARILFSLEGMIELSNALPQFGGKREEYCEVNKGCKYDTNHDTC